MKKKYSLILDDEFIKYCELNNITDIEKLAKSTFERGFTILKYGESPFIAKTEEIKIKKPNKVIFKTEEVKIIEPNKEIPSNKPIVDKKNNDLYGE